MVTKCALSKYEKGENVCLASSFGKRNIVRPFFRDFLLLTAAHHAELTFGAPCREFVAPPLLAQEGASDCIANEARARAIGLLQSAARVIDISLYSLWFNGMCDAIVRAHFTGAWLFGQSQR